MSSGIYEWIEPNSSTTGYITTSNSTGEPYVIHYDTQRGSWIDYQEWTFKKEWHDYSAFYDVGYRIKRALNKNIRTI